MPFEDLEVDFTEVKPCRGYWYLLVLICTYTGWVKAYPPHREDARQVVKALLREIIPRYGLPLSIGSDNGPAFVAEIVQGRAKILKVKWKLHIVHRPQSSEKVEYMNRTLKITLAKLCQETQAPWIDMLPLALLRACCNSRPSGNSSFEILYGRPPK
jgi:transposase InsO family protein